MKVHQGHECGRIGRRAGLTCAALGLTTAALIWFVMGGKLPPIQLISAIVALFFGSALLGAWAGRVFCRYRGLRAADAAIGMLVAFGSIFVSVFTGSLVTYLTLTEFRRQQYLAIVFLMPQIFVFMIGGFPAIFLGWLFAVLVRREFLKLGY